MTPFGGLNHTDSHDLSMTGKMPVERGNCCRVWKQRFEVSTVVVDQKPAIVCGVRYDGRLHFIFE